MTAGKRICLAAFAGAHGVRGAFKLKTFTANEMDIAAYGPLESENGAKRYSISIVRMVKPGLVIATSPEVESREDAKALSGVKLFVDRDRLPETEDEDEFYLEDLVGLRAEDEAGVAVGIVRAVHNFGAGDILDIRFAEKGGAMIPFTREAAPVVSLSDGKIVIARAALDAVAPSENDETGDAADPALIREAMRQEDA